MSTSVFADFGFFYNHLIKLYQDKCYAEGLALARREFDRFPEQAALLYHYCACMASCAGDGPLALRFLDEALAHGHWYTEIYWDDADLNLIKTDPEYSRLRALSLERAAAERTKTRPELVVEAPDGRAPSGPLPLLLALHGNAQNAATAAPFWRPAQKMGWLTAFPQSSQITGPNAFVWNEQDTREKELRDHFAALCQKHAIDGQRIVIGGFSLGGETAIVSALTGVLPVRGFVAVVPGGPLMNAMEQWKPLIAAAQGRGVRGYMVIGGKDHHAPEMHTLVEMLRAGGVACEMEEHPEMGHAFPPDFGERLDQILGFVLGDQVH